MDKIRAIRGTAEKEASQEPLPPRADRKPSKPADADAFATVVLSDVIATINQSVSQF